MKRNIFIRFTTKPYARKGEKQHEIVARVERTSDNMVRHTDGKAYFPICCQISPLTNVRDYPLDDELVFWDCEVQKGQFFVRSKDLDIYLRGQGNTAKIIRGAYRKEWGGRETFIPDDTHEVGEFFDKD